MPSTMRDAADATPRERLADVRPQQAKAELHAHVSATRLREVAAEALRRATSQKAAAIDIGIHEGRLSHKLKDGTLTLAQLEELGPTYAAELGEALIESFGALTDPKAIARRELESIENAVRTIRQFVDHVRE